MCSGRISNIESYSSLFPINEQAIWNAFMFCTIDADSSNPFN